jgi:hypothetical protein
MECQVEKNEHLRHLLLYEFSRGSKAAETAQKWFVHFKQGNFDMSDTLPSGLHLVGYEGDYPL